MCEVNLKEEEEIKLIFEYVKGVCINSDKEEPTFDEIKEFYQKNKKSYIEEYGDDETYSYQNYCEDLLYSSVAYD